MHPLRTMLEDAAAGRFPPVDGGLQVFAPGVDGHFAIVEFTGHSVVLGDLTAAELADRGADGVGGASHPSIKLALAGSAGWIGSQDAVLVATARRDGSALELTEAGVRFDDHPRVVRSRAHRSEVEVFVGGGGLVTLGDGLVGRRELSVELFESTRPNARAGRALIDAGLALVPPGELVWAQVAPGNAASLRAFLAAGFVPIGAETLIRPDR